MKKFLVVMVLCASVFAGVLETNDVKMNTLLGLGGNPAVIAVNKKVNFETGTVAVNKLSQNSKILNGTGTTEGRNMNDMSYADASKFFWFAGNVGENWFGFRHTNISNVYPYGTAKLQVGALQNALDPKYESKVTMFRKDTVESFSLLWARELARGYSAGVELAVNTYTLNDNTLYNSAAERLLIHPALAAKGIPFDSYKYSVSKPYYTVTFGLVKELDAVSKVSFAHKISQDRGIYYNDDAGTTYVYNEAMPNETGLAYVYRLNDAWEVAGVYKAFWGVNYQKNYLGSNNDYTEAVSKKPYNSLGFATDYRPSDKWTIQTYGNFIRNYKAENVSNRAKTDDLDRGYKVTQLGGNIQYNLNIIKGGTILLGSYVTKLQSEDKDVDYVFDITNTTLSYSQNF